MLRTCYAERKRGEFLYTAETLVVSRFALQVEEHVLTNFPGFSNSISGTRIRKKEKIGMKMGIKMAN